MTPKAYDPDDYHELTEYVPLRERSLTREIAAYNKSREVKDLKPVVAHMMTNQCHICRQPVRTQDPYMRIPTCLVCDEPGYYSRAVRNATIAGCLVICALFIAIAAIAVWENMI
jgi:hypothetical protein